MTGGSTDMGNVSQLLPSIHPIIGIRGSVHPPHTHGFADETATPAADECAIDGATAMALTVIDVAQDGALRAELEAEQSVRAPYIHQESAS